MKNKRAEMGIGTLIIFIAMILVAAIAAGVLLQTAATLQNKALQTGQKSKGQVSTTITPILLFADDGTDGLVENFFLKAKLAPGSDPIKLDELLLSFDLNNKSADLEFRQDSYKNNCSYGVNGFYTKSDGTGNFTVKYLINSSSNKNGYLQRGDVIQFCFRAPRSINEDEDLSIKLIPKVGTATYIESSTPDIMTDKRVVIYP
jgi:flagellin FlaB